MCQHAWSFCADLCLVSCFQGLRQQTHQPRPPCKAQDPAARQAEQGYAWIRTSSLLSPMSTLPLPPPPPRPPPPLLDTAPHQKPPAVPSCQPPLKAAIHWRWRCGPAAAALVLQGLTQQCRAEAPGQPQAFPAALVHGGRHRRQLLPAARLRSQGCTRRLLAEQHMRTSRVK